MATKDEELRAAELAYKSHAADKRSVVEARLTNALNGALASAIAEDLIIVGSAKIVIALQAGSLKGGSQNATYDFKIHLRFLGEGAR